MSADSDPRSLDPPDKEPTRALLLAQALETCIQAERRVPGSAEYVIARQPEWARAELRQLVALASSLEAAADSAVMSEQFRVAARARLMRHMTREAGVGYPDLAGHHAHVVSDGPWLTAVPSVQSRNGHHATRPRRRRSKRWVWRGGLGGLLAAVLIGAATLTASANALPGEPLYSVKQAREELGVRLAADDQARTLALLNSAEARLDETARLLQQGRTDQLTQTTSQYDDAITRATTTYVVTIAEAAPADPGGGLVENKLTQQQEQLQSMLSAAPEPARSDLREALDAAERGRALVAEPRPSERRGSAQRTSGVAAPTTAVAESEPTPITAPRASVPPPVDRVAQPPAPTVAEDEPRHGGNSAEVSRGGDEGDAAPMPPTAVVLALPGSAPNGRAAIGAPSASKHQDQKVENVSVAPVPAVAEVETTRQDGRQSNGEATDTDGGETRHGGGDQLAQQSAPSELVVAPSQNQNDERDRVAEQPQSQEPAAPVQAAVVQRSSSSSSNSEAARSSAQTANSGSGRASTQNDADSGSSTRTQLPAQQNVAVQPTPVVANQGSLSSSSDSDHRGSDSSSSSSSSGHSTSTSGQNTSGSRSSASSTSSSQNPSGSRSGSSPSTSGDHDGSRH